MHSIQGCREGHEGREGREGRERAEMGSANAQE